MPRATMTSATSTSMRVKPPPLARDASGRDLCPRDFCRLIVRSQKDACGAFCPQAKGRCIRTAAYGPFACSCLALLRVARLDAPLIVWHQRRGALGALTLQRELKGGQIAVRE